MVDQYRGIEVNLDSRVVGQVWQLPIFTVSLSEGGFERVYQGTTMLNVFRLVLGQGRKFDLHYAFYAGTVRQGASFRGARAMVK